MTVQVSLPQPDEPHPTTSGRIVGAQALQVSRDAKAPRYMLYFLSSHNSKKRTISSNSNWRLSLFLFAHQNNDNCCGGSSFLCFGAGIFAGGGSAAIRSASAITSGIFLKSSRITSFRLA